MHSPAPCLSLSPYRSVSGTGMNDPRTRSIDRQDNSFSRFKNEMPKWCSHIESPSKYFWSLFVLSYSKTKKNIFEIFTLFPFQLRQTQYFSFYICAKEFAIRSVKKWRFPIRNCICRNIIKYFQKSIKCAVIDGGEGGGSVLIFRYIF